MAFPSSLTILSYVLIPFLQTSMGIDSISILHSNSSLSDGMTLVSKGRTFELGFFTPGNSKKRYLGIWYKNIPIQTVVWVANRINPINIDSSAATLTLNTTGTLVLTQNDTVVWSSTFQKQVQNPVVAELLDSGNLVVRDEKEANPEGYLWQSFDYPTDTVLPEMKLGCDLRSGLNRRLTAWKSPEDPSPGDFSFTVALNNYPDFYMMKGDSKFFRTGPWNGMGFSGSPELKPNPLFNYKFVYNKNEVYYSYSLKNDSIVSRLVMNQTTHARYRYVWTETDQTWRLYSSMPQDYCDTYGLCGPYGNCILSDSPVCQCLEGFKPKSPQKWNLMDWSEGCVRNVELKCEDRSKVGFAKLSGLKVPDTTHTWVDETMGLEECRKKCLNNCSCMAYANSDVRGQGSGCAMWFGDLVDIRQFSVGGQDLYVRMDASELASQNGSRMKLIVAVATTVAVVLLMVFLFGCYYLKKVGRKMTGKSFSILPEKSNKRGYQSDEGQEEDMDLPLLQMSTIIMATENFSMKKKIGEGGFGPVYKGRLESGQKIAVKRLSVSSGQGITEFKNEVKLIAKLQHRNLVKLLGCCIEGQEKMLIYEYMSNGSLDSFIFDNGKRKVLDWSKRFNIINGIARGLLYLHQDSRLRIIHRDLKASNILLDDELNPKISDFGMARTFGGDQIEGNTTRVVGTYGYMSPEYAADGLFSIKSDVFSFGVLLLEIITGKRNRGFYHADITHNLVGHAWIQWKEGRVLELIDKNIENSCNESEVLRCIHIGLLCVQHNPEDRPTMSSVVVMLGSKIEMAEPKQPGFYVKKLSLEANSSSTQIEFRSANEMTISQLEAR
ncbi:G-type lectin S-receptor-like serine/threonine-protein kinase [Senna tora]|uniref:Receptor-like serine/threonine-protein kinase n=1 Tax=Senna tora TaxID=362788 RepID=A0A834WHE6_9FABA|nr:G-type lectin S-receptor-like serine/threonine-protein kinase [Senna tora]